MAVNQLNMIDMETLIAKSLRDFKEGSIVKGRILELRPREVLVDIGYKSEGVISRSEFDDVEDLQVGDEVEVLLVRLENDEGMVVLSKEKAAYKQNWDKIVKVFQGNPDAGLERTQTFEYFRTKPAERNPGRVALAFSTGDPAIIETRVGAGKSLLITTAVDQSWGNWAVWPSFLPLMQEIVFHAVSGDGSRDELLSNRRPPGLSTRAASATAWAGLAA